MHITESACEALGQLLVRKGDTERCLRLSTVQGNYRFILDEPIEQDIIFHHDGKVVLVVSETVSRDLWGITVDTIAEEGRSKLMFRKAKHGEPLDIVKEVVDAVPPQWRASEHERLLGEIAEIGRQIAALRGTKSRREPLQLLEAQRQQKWDAIRTLWAGDGGWHRRNGNAGGNPAAVPAKPAD